ncbi:beta-taxilin-like, partial [Asbolus verrucosus]
MDLANLKGPSDILASKVKAFKNLLELATECLTNKDYANAEMIYGSILADLHKDCFVEALNLNDLDLFSLHSCFAYSSIGSDFKSEQALVILNSIHKPIKLPLVPYLKAFVHISNDRISFANDELNMCQTLLNDGYNFKPNNILNEDIVPEINDEFLNELLKAKEDNEDLKRCFKENWLKIGKLCETDFAKWTKKTKTEETSKGTAVEKKAKQNPVQTGAIKKTEKQIQKNKTESVGIQATPPKGICVAVQTMEKDINKQLLTTVLDIKNKMNNLQNKKDNEIKQLQKKNNELHEKLMALDNKRQEKSSEFEFLKDQYFALEKKWEQSQKQTEFLQKLLVEQLQQKYHLQRNLYQLFEEKCDYKIEYLSDIQKFLSPIGKLSLEECQQEIFMWRNALDKISGAKKNFDMYYRSVDDLIVAKKYSSIKTSDWPGIPNIPTDMQDIIYRNFKSILQQDNKIHNPNYFAYNYYTHNEDGRTTGSPPSSSKIVPPIAAIKANGYGRPQSSNKNIGFSPSPSSPSPENGTNIYQSEQDLLKFLQSNFESVDELELLQAIYHIRDTHSGTLVGFQRQKLVSEIRKFLKKSKSAKSGWNNVTKAKWHNDHTESKCCICFEDYDVSNSYSLPCEHEFHKKCITSWLKRQSACPVCRVHAVMDEEFPPLKS